MGFPPCSPQGKIEWCVIGQTYHAALTLKQNFGPVSCNESLREYSTSFLLRAKSRIS